MNNENYDLFMKGLIPFLPIEGVKIPNDIVKEVNNINLESHPIYIFDKYVLLGDKIENYDELLKTIMCNIIHILPVEKGQNGGGKIANIIKKYEGEVVHLGIALLLIFVAIVNIIRIQNTSIMQTTTYKQKLSNEKALVVIDNKALMLPKLDLGPEVNEITKKITVGEFLQASLGFNKDLITKATLIMNYEIEKQKDAAMKQLRDNQIPQISRNIFNNFMITQGTDIRAKDGEILDINNIQKIINEKINNLKPTSRIFAAYKFSLAATTSDLIDSIDNAIQKFKRTTTAELENQGADALFVAKAHLKNIFRDLSTSGYLIYSALGYLLTAYSYRKWRLYREKMNQTIEDQQETINVIEAQIIKYQNMLGIEMDDRGHLTRRNVTRGQAQRLTTPEIEAGHGQLLVLKQGGGKRRKRRKTRRKKRRKTRRKSKKRKSKRRRRKRKTKRKRRKRR